MRFSGANARRLTAAAIAVTMALASLVFAKDAAAAEILVTVDGRLLIFDDIGPQIINDRVMLPVRAVGESMNATLYWNEAQREVFMTLHDRFIRLVIGETHMDYGYFSEDGGVRNEFNINVYALDSPAVLVNDRTLVPLRAISEGLGGEVAWNAEARVAMITSPAAPQTSAPITSAPQTVVDETLFDDTLWFENISAARAQAMYENGEKFALAYYSNDTSSRLYTPLIKDAAKESGLKVYAVNADAPDADDLIFIWDYIDEDELKYPMLFRVYGKRSVGVDIQPNSQSKLTSLFISFMNNVIFGPSSGLDDTDPSSSPTKPLADLADNIDRRFNAIDRAKANSMLENGDTFVYVYYNSSLDDSDEYLERIKQAAIDVEVDIYGTDVSAYNYSERARWWGNPNGDYMTYPVIYFIEGMMVDDKLTQPLEREYEDLKALIIKYRRR